jgi:hypothetical protein
MNNTEPENKDFIFLCPDSREGARMPFIVAASRKTPRKTKIIADRTTTTNFSRSHTINSEQIQGSTEGSYPYLLNVMTKLEVPRLEIEAHQLIIELQWTDILQGFVDYANKNVFRSFSLYLKMEITPNQHVDALEGDVR